MKRNFKPLVVVMVLSIASILTITRRGSHGVLGFGAVESLRAAPASDKKPYDLTALHIFDSALKRINDSYVDPTRIEPKAMLLAALDQVQKQVAEVLVEPRPEKNKVHVRVDTAQREFDIAEVDSPWMLSRKMQEIFRFVSGHLQPGTDLKELEYAATNGMLNTLDPHSVLLEPQVYAEMKLTTHGQFGGLGIVIGIRKGVLTVIKPMPGTPAAAAGIKAGDHIVRIEKQSTVNMMLNDAVNKLRGDPDTKVEVWIQRADSPSKKLVLTRAVIQVETVQAHMLKDGVGYIKISQFSGNTNEAMRAAIEQMKPKGLRGLVLDLRGDPGGLLDQAIKVADEFLDSGTIVTTVGLANKQREEKRANPGNQPKIPIGVLVNGGSASASEIVAGALKNLDRAVVIGSRTFGKGSVQVLYDNDDGSALKLTIAQYLTPGDVSIQSVGIMPDVAIEATSLSKERITLFRQSHNLREQDLDAHLTSRNAASGDEKPLETIRYLSEKAAKKKEAKAIIRDEDKEPDEAGEGEEPEEEPLDDSDKFVEDYEISFARDLVGQAAQAHVWRRHDVIASSKAFFEHKTAEEQTKIGEALKKLGVDWTPTAATAAAPSGSAKPLLSAELSTDKPGDRVAAGDKIHLKATVTNKGTGVANAVRGITRCDDPFMADREFVFGRLAPGESRTWTVPIAIDKAALSRLDRVKLEVADDRDAKVVLDPIKVEIDGLKRPRFAYAYQLVDDVRGNGDGVVQPGEEVRLHVVVKNAGEGKSYETVATLSNKSGEGVDVNKGRFNVNNLAPNETKTVDFTFEVAPDYKGDTFAVQMDVYDQVLHEYVTDKLTFPVQGVPVPLQSWTGTLVVAKDQAELRSGCVPAAVVVGRAAKGAAFKVTAKNEAFYRIEAETGRPAFIAVADAAISASAKVSGSGFAPALQVVPPRLVVDGAPFAVNAPVMKLKVDASDEQQIADSYVFVSNRSAKIDHRKVFYRSNRGAATPKSLVFDAEIPLWPGANQVTVVARQSNQVQSLQTLIVDREGGDQPTRAALNSKTPPPPTRAP